MSDTRGEIGGAGYWEDCLYRQLAWAAGLSFVDLHEYRVSPGMLRKVDAGVARRRRWVPMIFNTRRVVLVVDDPAAAFELPEHELARELEVPQGRRVEFALAAPSAIDGTLARYDG